MNKNKPGLRSYRMKRTREEEFPHYMKSGFGLTIHKVTPSPKNYSGADLSGQDFSNANFTGANFRGANLTNANLTNANLTNANLTNATLTNANFTGANFRGANLTNANLTNANLTNANLTNATLTNANLTNANLTNANLTGATLTGVVGVIDFNNIKFDGKLTVEYGGGGGTKFSDTTTDNIKIKLESGDVLDKIYINETGYGGNGGGKPGTEISLSPDEYINEVTMSRNFFLYRYLVVGKLEIKTSKGQTISGGKIADQSITFDKSITLKNIKVTEIGGRSGDYVDSISITFTKI